MFTGDALNDTLNISNFKNNNYNVAVFAPNGFYRNFKGDANDPQLQVYLSYHTNLKKIPTGNVQFGIKNNDIKPVDLEITDNAYGVAKRTVQLNAHAEKTIICYLDKSYNWYDFSIKQIGNTGFEKRYCGHVETGKESKSDPLMGMMI